MSTRYSIKIHPSKGGFADISDNAGLDVVARQRERQKVQSAQKEYLIEFVLDLVDILVKTIVVSTYSGDFIIPVAVFFSVACLLR